MPGQREVRRSAVVIFAALAIALAVPAGAGAFEPGILTLHSPVLPLKAGGVWPEIVYAVSLDPSIVASEVEVWEQHWAVVQCSSVSNPFNQPPCLVPAAMPTPSTVGVCVPTGGECTVTTGLAPTYDPDVAYIVYWAVAVTSAGRLESRRIGYALGDTPWLTMPNFSVSPIPIYMTPETGDPTLDERRASIDVVFIPDADYVTVAGADFKATFVADVTGIMRGAYLSSAKFASEVRAARGQYNFYLTFETGQAKSGCQVYEGPADWQTMQLTADAGLIVYHGSFIPCAQSPGASGGLMAMSLPRAATYGYSETIHEAGHAVYRLSDEYGGWVDPDPTTLHRNVFLDRTSCTGPPQCNKKNSCKQIGTTRKYRCDGDGDLMVVSSSASAAFDLCDQARITYKHGLCSAGSCY
jgi:hypothetical protein